MKHNLDAVLAIACGLMIFALLILGHTSTNSSSTLDEVDAANPLKFLGLSSAAWHQEFEVYFTLKTLSRGPAQGLGFREPLSIEQESKETFPLKYNDYIVSSKIVDRPYLSSSGVLSDIGKLAIGLAVLLGLSHSSGLMFLYAMNVLLNCLFIFLLLSFGSKYIPHSLVRGVYKLAVCSPWIILDSTSLMLSPAIRFGGMFTFLVYLFTRKSDISKTKLLVFIVLGLIFSTLNGFEFFFFELAILLLYLGILFRNSTFSKTLSLWFLSVSISWVGSLFVWWITVYSNLKSFGDSNKVLVYTLFKHSFLRSSTPPPEVVASGDSSLNPFVGLMKLLFDMSILLPYPFPESLQSRLGLGNTALSILVHLSSFSSFFLLLIFLKKNIQGLTILFPALGFWCLSAVATNSYVYNHPHHMPPVGLFLLLAVVVFVSVERVKNSNTNY